MHFSALWRSLKAAIPARLRPKPENKCSFAFIHRFLAKQLIQVRLILLDQEMRSSSSLLYNLDVCEKLESASSQFPVLAALEFGTQEKGE